MNIKAIILTIAFFLILISSVSAVSKFDYLSLINTEVDFNHACSYYEITNPKAINLDINNGLSISEWKTYKGTYKNPVWQIKQPYEVQTWVPKVICYKNKGENATGSTCIDEGHYIIEIKYKWVNINENIDLRPYELKELRFCADIDRIMTKKGFAIELDHVPKLTIDGQTFIYQEYDLWNNSFEYYHNISGANTLRLNEIVNISIHGTKCENNTNTTRIVTSKNTTLDYIWHNNTRDNLAFVANQTDGIYWLYCDDDLKIAEGNNTNTLRWWLDGDGSDVRTGDFTVSDATISYDNVIVKKGTNSLRFEATNNNAYVRHELADACSGAGNLTFTGWIRGDADASGGTWRYALANTNTLANDYEVIQNDGNGVWDIFNGVGFDSTGVNDADVWRTHTTIANCNGNKVHVYINDTYRVASTDRGTADNIQYFFTYGANAASDGNIDDSFMCNGDACMLYYDQTILTIGPQLTNVSYLKVTFSDIFTGTALTLCNASINGTVYNTITGTALTTVALDGKLYNVTAQCSNNGGYHYQIINNFNASAHLQTNLSKYYRIYNYSLTNNMSDNGINYARNLTYAINLSCPSFATSEVFLYSAGTLNLTLPLTCTNGTINLSGIFKPSTEGNRTLSFFINTSYRPGNNSQNITGNHTYIFDLYAPSAIANFTAPIGFNNKTTNVSLICIDSIMPALEYNLTFNGALLHYNASATNNSQISNKTILADGANNITGICSDLFNDTINSYSQTAYSKLLALIDEKENAPFDVRNASSVRVYFDDNSSFFDFQANGNLSTINFTSLDNDKLRFEIIYTDGTLITRYVDVSLVNGNVRVCANKDDITHYEQLIIAATERPAVLLNVFSDCVVAADYTRFAYQDSLVLKAYTIASMYYLYAFDEDNNKIILASVDGSIATYINLDNLEFVKEGYDINILGDTVSFEKTAAEQMSIFYKNNDADNERIDISITNMETNAAVLQTYETTNPNEFTIVFNYATLNLTNTTLFKIMVNKTATDGTTSQVLRYFNTNAKYGIVNAGFVFIISLLLMAFGFTMVSSRTTFSWFGIFICIAAISTLSFAIATWYITFLMVMEVIILVYTIIIMVQQNLPTIT